MRRLAALAIGLGLLALIWWRADVSAILAAARSADPMWLGLGLAAVIPLTLGTAWRFRMLSRTPLRLGSATRLILSASTLNLFLPSKMGDLAKAWVLTNRYAFEPRLAVALVVLEKLLDLASLLALGVLALVWIGPGTPLLLLAAAALAAVLLLLVLLMAPLPLAPWLMTSVASRLPGRLGRGLQGFGEEWREAVVWFWAARGRLALTVSTSLALWLLHLAQFWLFACALGHVPFVDNMAFATLAILVGLAPVTIAGIGTRDAAIVLFYGAWLGPAGAAVLGVLATLRYVLPAIAGLPFVRDFWVPREAAAG